MGPRQRTSVLKQTLWNFGFPHGFDASLGSYRLVRHNRIDSDHFHSVILRFTNSHESVNTEIALNPL